MFRKSASVALVLVCALLFSNVAAFAQSTPAGAADTRVASLGLSIVANPATGVTTLTRQQVALIFRGVATNWKQLGGPDLKIAVIGRGDGGASNAFAKVYLDGTRLSSNAVERQATSDAVSGVLATSGAISYIYSSEVPSVDGVAIIAVSDVRATDATGVVDLGSEDAATTAGAYQVIGKVSAGQAINAVAPTQMGLNSLQAHSLITRDFIEENASPIAEFTRIATIAPSVSNTGAVNGPGLSEQKLVIRGMGADFTNLTFDGIPVSDTNDPSYHSTSFFPELIVGGVDVVRGPGFASNHGYATFGGSENVFTVAPSERPSLTFAGSAGTYMTQIAGVAFQSGRQPWLGNGTVQATFQNTSSNGYLSGNKILSRNYSFKFERPLGDRTLLDAFATWNDQSFNAADAGPGATFYEISTFGPDYSLNNNPASGECACYNYQIKTTDLGYIRLRSDLGRGFSLDNKVYTYRYDNETTASNAVGQTATTVAAGTLPSQGTITCVVSSAVCTAPLVAGSLAANGLVYNPLDVAGYLKRNKYITIGDIIDITKNFGRNFVRAGVWLEHASTDRHQYSVDLTTGQYDYVNGTGCLFGSGVAGTAFAIAGATPAVVPINCAAAAGTLPGGLKQLPGPNSGALANGVPIGATKFDQQSAILNAQPFIEAQWILPTGTTIYPGVKFLNITRYDNAQIQNTARTPQATNRIPYTSTLPFLSVNQTISRELSAYFQYGTGYEIPDLKTFYVANPLLNSTQPNQSTTYQMGVIGKAADISWDVNYYTINFTNLQTSLNVDAAGNLCAACAYTAFFNIGGARYKGIETEATFNLGGGFAAYGNLSTDLAKELTFNTQVNGVPDMTAAMGILYKTSRFDASLIYKMIGQSFLNAYTPANAANYFDPNQQIQPYGLLDLSLVWKTSRGSLQLNAYNLTNSQTFTTVQTQSLTSTTLMNHIAPPSMLLTFKVKS